MEVEALATIMEKNVRSFIWRCIVCRFGIPKVLVSDNGKQFDNDPFPGLLLAVRDKKPLLLPHPHSG